MKIELLDHCADDLKVANSARVSLDKWHDEFISEGDLERDDLLVNFLMGSRHGSPFEKGYFEFRIEAPIFVFREWHRHRAGHSYNEMSGRYTELEPKFYVPDEWRMQTGKPGAYTYVPITDEALAQECYEEIDDAYTACWYAYEQLLKKGVAKEQARVVLPLGIYSKMIWTCNPRSLMHFCSLRNHPQAQAEIAELAAAVEDEFTKIMPYTAEAFVRHGRVCP